MTEEFNKWWDSDGIAEENSYREGAPVFWAWEGWQAAMQAEREACAALCDKISDDDGFEGGYANYCAHAIRARGQE